MDVIVDRCAGLDVHKNTVMAAVREPGGVGGRSEVVREFSTFTADLVRLGEWLAGERVSQVVMEATGELPPDWRTSSLRRSWSPREGCPNAQTSPSVVPSARGGACSTA